MPSAQRPVEGGRARIGSWEGAREGGRLSDNSQGRLQVRRGFTILELVVGLAISAAFLGFAGWTFGAYVHRTSAQRAAQLFARDLALARASAIRGREPVVIRFNEASRWYRISTLGSGTEIVRRRFGWVAGDPEAREALGQLRERRLAEVLQHLAGGDAHLCIAQKRRRLNEL